MKKKIYLAVMLISIIATGILLFNRIGVERASKSVEILADFEEFAIMAKQQGIPEIDMFTMLREAGVTGVALKEETLFNMVLEGKALEYRLAKNVLSDLDWKDKYGRSAIHHIETTASGYDLVVRTYDQSLFDMLKANVTARYDADFYTFFDEEINTIVFKGAVDDVYFSEDERYRDYNSKSVKVPKKDVSSMIEDMGVGFDESKIQLIKEAGLSVNLRPSNYHKFNTNIVDAYFKDVEKYGEMPNVLIFNGSDILSYTKEKGIYQHALYERLKELDLPIGLVEASDQLGFIDQNGIKALTRDLEYNVVRIFPVIEYIQQRYNYLGYYEGGKEIENTMYRAITERNIRVIYFRPFKSSKLTYFTDLEEYKRTFEGLEKRLEAHNITIGSASVIPYNHISIYLVILSAFGLLILGLVILKLVFDISDKFEWVLLGVGGLGIIGLNFVAPNTSIDIFAFSAANIFATLAVIFLIEFIKDLLLSNKVFTLKGIIGKSILGLSLLVLISFVGGLYVSAMMSRTDYLIEVSYFRGVKASLMLPMVAFVVIYLIKLGYRRNVRELEETTYFMEDIKRFVTLDVKMYYLMLAAALAGVLYIYLARSGHSTNIEVLNIELIFRNWLENVFIARPRTKEIFIAYPALFAAFYFAARGYNKILFPFMLAAVTGITSIINTFCHARTPVYLSTSRTLISFGFGVVIGILVIFLLELCNRIYVANFGSKKYE